MEQQDLLLDIEKEMYFVEKASRGARFADYFVDIIIIGIIQRFGTNFLYLFFVPRTNFSTYDDFSDSATSRFAIALYSLLISYLSGRVLLFIYYTVFEGSTQGRTIGKLITGSRAVRKDGAPFTWKEACLRSLCRMIPFEAWSGFATPWHDTITNTQVVKVQR